MFSKTIEYTDFNGDKDTETFYFHLTKPKLVELAGDGTLQQTLDEMIASKDIVRILRKLTEIVSMAIGKRSDDGKRFLQSDEITAELTSSPAFDDLMMDLMTDEKMAADFVNNLIPKDLQEQMAAAAPGPFKNPPNPPNHGTTLDHSSWNSVDETTVNYDQPKWLRERRNPTKAETRNMSREELQHAFSLRATFAAEAAGNNQPAWLREKRAPTEQELTGMSNAEYALVQQALGNGTISF